MFKKGHKLINRISVLSTHIENFSSSELHSMEATILAKNIIIASYLEVTLKVTGRLNEEDTIFSMALTNLIMNSYLDSLKESTNIDHDSLEEELNELFTERDQEYSSCYIENSKVTEKTTIGQLNEGIRYNIKYFEGIRDIFFKVGALEEGCHSLKGSNITPLFLQECMYDTCRYIEKSLYYQNFLPAQWWFWILRHVRNNNV